MTDVRPTGKLSRCQKPCPSLPLIYGAVDPRERRRSLKKAWQSFFTWAECAPRNTTAEQLGRGAGWAVAEEEATVSAIYRGSEAVP